MTTYNRKMTDLALMVQVVDSAGSLKIEATPVHVQDNGELHSVGWRYWGEDPGAFLDGFKVECYLGGVYGLTEADNEKGTWGFGYHFAPYRIERASHAKAIAETMTKLDRGMEALRDSDGYLTDADFYRYVLRVAKVLKMPAVYVRKLRQSYEFSGERFRRVDAPALQSWMDSVIAARRKGERSQLIFT